MMGVPSVASSAPRADAPVLRSGRIVGSGDVGGNLPCSMTPECAAWLQSGCDPALAGRNPAALTSIVDVSRLANGKTRHVLQYRHTLLWSGVRIELWRGNCGKAGECLRPELSDPPTYANWHGLEGLLGCPQAQVRPRTRAGDTWWPMTFVIPRGVKWMTVGASSAVNTEWTLH